MPRPTRPTGNEENVREAEISMRYQYNAALFRYVYRTEEHHLDILIVIFVIVIYVIYAETKNTVFNN